MDAQGLVRSLETSSGGKVVVKVGDQYFEVQSAYDWHDAVCLSLGGNFLPEEGGGTQPSVTEQTDVTPATGTPARDAQSVAGNQDAGHGTGNRAVNLDQTDAKDKR